MRVKVHTESIYHSGDEESIGFYTPGIYKVEVRAWGDNSQDTGASEELQITVIDPCTSATLSIDASVLKNEDEVTLTTFVGYPAAQIEWTDLIISSSLSDDLDDQCGAYTHELSDADSGLPLAAEVYPTIELSSAVKTLEV